MSQFTLPRLWDELNTTTLGGPTAATADEITTQTDPIHIQASNLAAIQSANIINAAAMRDGSCMPGTGQAFNLRIGDTTRSEWFTPQAGEVWELMAATANANQAPSSAYYFTLYYAVGDQDDTQRVLYVGQSKDVDTQIGSLNGFFTNLPMQCVGENTTVQVSVNNMRGTTYIDLDIYAMRIR